MCVFVGPDDSAALAVGHDLEPVSAEDQGPDRGLVALSLLDGDGEVGGDLGEKLVEREAIVFGGELYGGHILVCWERYEDRRPWLSGAS